MKIAGKSAIYHKLVFEVRYEEGWVYLDRCGTTVNRILSTYPDWVVKQDGISPLNALLVNLDSGTHFNFGSSPKRVGDFWHF